MNLRELRHFIPEFLQCLVIAVIWIVVIAAFMAAGSDADTPTIVSNHFVVHAGGRK